jgi:putative ABC transport system substrate-binding protein
MRFDGGEKNRLPKLADELVKLEVDLLAVTSAAGPAARGATTAIPIVVCDAYDAVDEGFTTNLRRPQGNLTGASGQSRDTAIKRVELIRELLPYLKRVGILTDPVDTGARIDANGVREAAARLGLEVRAFDIRQTSDLPKAFAAIKRYQPQVLMVPASTLAADNLKETVRFASSARLPLSSELSAFADAGMLLTYGVDYSNLVKLSANQTDKILKGARPADLPWEQPTEFELVVNTKVAKALGLTIPESIMLRATKVIR